MEVISTVNIAVIVYRIQRTNPSFILPIQGFVAPQRDFARIQLHIAKCLKDAGVRQRAFNLISATRPLTDDATKNLMVDEIMASLQLELVEARAPGGLPSPVINIFLNSPLVDADTWKTQWRACIRSISFASNIYGPRAHAMVPCYTCLTCHSNTHPTGLCPFPELKGWLTKPRNKDHTAAAAAIDQTNPAGYSSIVTNKSAGKGKKEYRGNQNWNKSGRH